MTKDQFKLCFETHFEGLLIYAFTIVKDRAEAKDIVQSSFVKLWESSNTVTEAKAAKSFLYKVVYRKCLNVLRNDKIRNRHHENLKKVESGQTIFSAEDKELKKFIQAAIEALPQRCREVFIRVRVDGMKYREVAEEMGISQKTVETQMSRALQHIRGRIGDAIVLLAIFGEILNRLIK